MEEHDKYFDFGTNCHGGPTEDEVIGKHKQFTESSLFYQRLTHNGNLIPQF